MLNLARYRRRDDRLADHLPWAALVAPGVVLNKDGSFQRSIRYRGPDLESATASELMGASARLNNVLRRFGSGWVLHFDADRRPALHYPQSQFPDTASWLLDEERRSAFEGRHGQYFESFYHLTLTYLPPEDQARRVQDALLDRRDPVRGRDWRQDLKAFIDETDRAIDLMATFMPEVSALDDGQTLTFLHGAISPNRQTIAVPSTPVYLDALLVDTPISGGLEPMLGDHHLRSLTIQGFPTHTEPALLDGLNHQGFSYRWSTRFIAMDRMEASRALTSLRRQWFNKRKSIANLLREVMYGGSSALVDSDADNKAADADLAMQALGSDQVAFGYFTSTLTVMDRDALRADEMLQAAEAVITGLGFTCIRESINAVEAWLGSAPGHAYANVRQPLLHTLNLAHMAPLSAAWAGPSADEHLGQAPWMYGLTAGSTPFRISNHVGDVGHIMVVGPTGAGKSVLLTLMAMQFRRYDDAQVYIFDKGDSARAAVLAMGGQHLRLAGAGGMSFQPLGEIDQEAERSWAAQWLGEVIAKTSPSSQQEQALWSALCSLATAPRQERTLTGLCLLSQSADLTAALKPYTLAGQVGGVLDAACDPLALSDVVCFEVEDLMGLTSAVGPVLSYLFHRLEARFDGRPTLVVLDEAWIFLDNPAFAGQIREWLRVLRKKNVSVVFATQSLSDVAQSAIAPALIESCPQRIFLANERAAEPQTRAVYEGFGLNPRQIDLIARASPKRHYFLQSRQGARVFELGLGPVGLAFCAASGPAAQARIDKVLGYGPHDRFAERYLALLGLGDEAEQAAGFNTGKDTLKLGART